MFQKWWGLVKRNQDFQILDKMSTDEYKNTREEMDEILKHEGNINKYPRVSKPLYNSFEWVILDNLTLQFCQPPQTQAEAFCLPASYFPGVLLHSVGFARLTFSTL